MRTVMMTLIALKAATAISQVTITSTQRLDLPAGRHWSAPRFSPDGQSIFLTTSGYSGIWQFRPGTRSLQQITAEPGAGYGYSLSSDGMRIAYRKTSFGTSVFDRTQEIIEVDLRTLNAIPVARGRNLSLPVYQPNGVVYQEMAANDLAAASGSSRSRPVVLGIDRTKIVLLVNGTKQLFDPYGDGSYIWPRISPDGTRMVAYEMKRGTFVCTMGGKVTAELGKLDGAVWTRSGEWIVYMEDRDDGHAITASDLYCVTPDGVKTIRLTSTPAIELTPDCSPTDNLIVCSTLNGEIHLMRYEEVER